MQYDNDYLNDYLKSLALEPTEKNRALAQWALNAPVPAGWNEGSTPEGDSYYWRQNADGTKEVRWEHPIDDVIKQWSKVGSKPPSNNQQSVARKEIVRDDSDQILENLIKKNQEYDRNRLKQQILQDNLFNLQRAHRKKKLFEQALSDFEKEKTQLRVDLWNQLDNEFQNQMKQRDEEIYDQVEQEIQTHRQKLNQKLLSLKLQEDKIRKQIADIDPVDQEVEKFKFKQIQLEKKLQDYSQMNQLDSKEKYEINQRIIKKLIELLCDMKTVEFNDKENQKPMDQSETAFTKNQHNNSTTINKTVYDFLSLF